MARQAFAQLAPAIRRALAYCGTFENLGFDAKHVRIAHDTHDLPAGTIVPDGATVITTRIRADAPDGVGFTVLAGYLANVTEKYADASIRAAHGVWSQLTWFEQREIRLEIVQPSELARLVTALLGIGMVPPKLKPDFKVPVRARGYT